jgi:peroxiredoxin
VWAGFALVLVGIVSYPFLFIRFPATRDFPWANFVLLAIAIYLLAGGVRRAFRQPTAYRGKVSGPILASLGALLIGFFLVEIFYLARQVPASLGAPRAGQMAPDFTLPATNGGSVTLSALLNSSFGSNDWPAKAEAHDKTAGAVLIFYRGYWWPACNSELRSFQRNLPEFNARRIRVVGISVDPPRDSELLRKTQGYSFLFLSDQGAQVIRQWDLVHPHAGVGGADVARPAEFLVDSSGTVRWVNLSGDYLVRARPKQVLQAVDAMNLARN